MDILVLFLILEEKFLAFHHYIYEYHWPWGLCFITTLSWINLNGAYYSVIPYFMGRELGLNSSSDSFQDKCLWFYVTEFLALLLLYLSLYTCKETKNKKTKKTPVLRVSQNIWIRESLDLHTWMLLQVTHASPSTAPPAGNCPFDHLLGQEGSFCIDIDAASLPLTHPAVF